MLMNSECEIKQKSHSVNLIAKTRLNIWDEAPMMHKHCFEVVDRTLRDVLRSYNNDQMDIPFGGHVFGGDFRQILPVVLKGSRQNVVQVTINLEVS